MSISIPPRHFIVTRQLGFALSVILAFVGGVHWGTRHLPAKGEPGPGKAPSRGTAPRSTSIRTEPEDFFPVAEFRKQSGLLIGCYDHLNANPRLYADIARALRGRLPVFGLVHSREQAERGRRMLRENGLPEDAMHFLPLPANTMWVRDYAPFMVRREDESIVMVDARYQSRNERILRRRDEEMATALSRSLDLPMQSIPLVLHGGNFLSNGDGIVVASTRMLQKNQELRFDQQHIGEILNDYLGVWKIFLVAPLEGEKTGHVDMFATLLAKDVAVVGQIDPETDPENSRRLDASADYLANVVTSVGPMKVSRIPMPPRWGEFWRSYTNVIMANGVLLVPSFSDVDPAVEERVEEVYRSLLPGWEIRRILCDTLVRTEGQLHCISYNIPAYVSLDHLFALARGEVDD